MYHSASDHIHNIPWTRVLRCFPAEMEALDGLDKITLICKKRSTDAIYICCVANVIWGRGISQCGAVLELFFAPAMSVISLGHFVDDVWWLQRTVSGGVSCKVNIAFICNNWVKPAAKFIRHSAAGTHGYKTQTHLFINKALNSTLIPDSFPCSINLFCSLK